MKEVKRWDFYFDCYDEVQFYESDKGKWVKYEDHLNAVEEAKQSTLRPL